MLPTAGVTAVAAGSIILSETDATGSSTDAAGVSFTEVAAVTAALPESLKGTCVAVSYTHLTLPTILRV